MRKTVCVCVRLWIWLVLLIGAWWSASANSYLLYEDFNDGVANGFYQVGGTWSVASGRYNQTGGACPVRSWVNALGHYIIQVECTPVSGVETKIIYAHADSGENYRVDFWLDRSRLSIPAWGQDWSTRNFTVGGLTLAYNQSYAVKIEVSWKGVAVWVNDVLQHDQTWANDWPLGDGNIGLGTIAASTKFDDLIVSVPLVGLRTVFIEDFNDGVADGFTEVSGSWSVISGKYVQSSLTGGVPYRTWVDALGRSLSEDLSAYVIDVDCTQHSGQETKVIYAHADVNENYRVDFFQDRSRLSIPAWGQGWNTRNVTLNGLTLPYGQTYHVTIEVSWAGVRVWVDGVLQHDEPWRDDIPLGDGRVGVGTCVSSSSFDNLIVSASTGPTGRVWYVDKGAAPGGNGTTWSKAFNRIQTGIDAATNGDFVIVAYAWYFENIRLNGKNITLRGMDPLDEALSYNTIIDGQEKGPTVTFTGAENEGCLISGLTIGYGKAPFGGGILGGTSDRHARAYLRHVSVGSNAAEDSGGGIAYFDGTILNSGIGSNWTLGADPKGNGGGLYQCHGPIRNSEIGKNTSQHGAGLYQCNGIIEYNTIFENSADRYGGGLNDCDGLVRYNTITNNSGLWAGGAANCDGEIRYNTISQNSCTWLGGGLYMCSGWITNNIIDANEACRGGGLSLCDAYVFSNTITNNSAVRLSSIDPGNGGGLYKCTGLIRNNTIAFNNARDHGGGLSFCDAYIYANIIAGNHARGSGGGLYECIQTRNNLIAGNEADNHGGGLFRCDQFVENNTIVGNYAHSIGGGLASCTGKVQGCIVWGNTALSHPQLDPADIKPTYCCIQNWTGGGEGNTSADPKFIDADGPDNNPATYLDNNYRLVDGSKCIDVGKNESWMVHDVDLDGNPRVFFGEKSLTVDMGAYEYASFPFRIVKVEKTSSGQQRLTWNSRTEDVYMVWSSLSSPAQSWKEENKVASQGASTTWADPNKMDLRKFYKIELLQ